MNKTTAALKLAEEALETAPIEYDFHGEPVDKEFAVLSNKALAAIREALAEQEKQEPVAWMHTFAGDVQINNLPAECYGDHWTRTPLYAAPVQQVDLTDDEIEWLVVDTLETWNSKDTMKDFARAVIAADREKNK